MKVHLLHPDRDADLERPLPPNAEALAQDLELDTLLDAMARGDDYLRGRAQRALLLGLDGPGEIRYRQDVLADCLAQPAAVRRLYELSVEGVETKRKGRFFWFRDSADSQLAKSLGMLELLTDVLRRLRKLAEENASTVASEGLTRLFETLRRELDDDYLAIVDRHLRELAFRNGALISAELGRGNRGTRHVLRAPRRRGVLERLTPGWPDGMTFVVPARDEAGLQALADIRNRGIAPAANALAQSTDHILAFFAMLRAEVGFYVGCLNLHEQLVELGVPTCLPEPLDAEAEAFAARGLRDPALAFHLGGGAVVGNDVVADGKRLVVVTGANQGGKSTFLRSVGLAQLMLHAGMFVAAESFRCAVARGVFTHFKREEDAGMTSGKLDEELRRMSELSDLLRPASLLLCNESFASTNEAEGSEIGRQVLGALVEGRVRVVFVTHLYDLAHSLYEQRLPHAAFLRAEREPDGGRSFELREGEPLPTSYGADSYRRIFATS